MKKNNLLKKINCAGIILFFPLLLLAQDENIFPLKYNAAIGAARLRAEATGNDHKISSAVNDTLLLPFFDDFSKYTVWPSAERWSDSSVFINDNFGINPPTIGMATFDGLDEEGNPYNNTNANANGLCDELHSLPIDLFADENGLPYNASDSIFLVFYYQRKGRGDAPESTDSLVLQFFDPATLVWTRVWKGNGIAGGDTTFSRVKISINEPGYRQKGFKFRFRNYGSQTGNLDIWNVDYVSLRKFLPPDYENIRDFAYVYPGTSHLSTYSAIPWKHFSQLPVSQQQSFVKPNADLTIRNNNEANPFPIKVAGTSFDQYGNPTPIVGGGGLNSIQIPLNTNVSPPAALSTINYFQDPTSGDQAVFTIQYEMGLTTGGGNIDDYPQNDTMKYIQNFHNYYAYDDGSAELGYGVNGVGAQLALKFDILQPDTLRAVKIYFTQIGLNISNNLFKLAVWTGASGPTGSPIYEKFNQTTNYTDSINGFYNYLTDPLFLNTGTYYIGFIQNSSYLINLGLDINTPADQSRKFINTTGSWVNSQLPGTWMIRPVLSSTPIDVGIDDPSAPGITTEFYPVPASDLLNISFNHPQKNQFHISLYDISGRLVFFQELFSESVSVSSFENGIYLLRLTNPLSGESFSGKVIIK